MKQSKQRQAARCSVHFGNMENHYFVSRFYGCGSYDKDTTAFRFLVLVFVLHLNILAKHNKGNFGKSTRHSLPHLSPRILKNLALPINIEELRDAMRQRDRHTSVVNE
jgi:hypothetical protein